MPEISIITPVYQAEKFFKKMCGFHSLPVFYGLGAASCR
mgnify:FL=1